MTATKKNPDPGSEAPQKSLGEKREVDGIQGVALGWEKKTIVHELPVPVQTTALAKPLPTIKEALELAVFLHDGGLFKKGFPTKAAVVTAIEYGRELGFQPVQALQVMHVIDGKLGIEAKGLQAIAMFHGMRIQVLDWTDQLVTLRFIRPGHHDSEFTYTHNDARLAGLLHKDNWVKEKKVMLYNRALSKGLRAFHPDVVLGLYTTDEIQDFDQPAPEIKDAQEINRGPVAAQAEVVETKPEPKPVNGGVKTAPADMQPKTPKADPDPRLLKALKPTDLQISAVFDYLAKLQEFGRDPAQLQKEISRRVSKFFKTEIKTLDDVTKQQMEWVIDILTKTVKAEEDKAAAKNEDPKEDPYHPF